MSTATLDRVATVAAAAAPLQLHVLDAHDRRLLITLHVVPPPASSLANELVQQALDAGLVGMDAIDAATQELARRTEDVLDRLGQAVEPLAGELVDHKQAQEVLGQMSAKEMARAAARASA
jgi:hypothetical protein